jgi:NAD-dependent dihydropyrimidine dehydrogenase PreA subunit
MRKDAIFIGVDVEDALVRDPEVAARLAEVCPVDIYAQKPDGTLDVVQGNLDECVLCRLCLDATPEGGVKVLKLYEEGGILA